MPTKKNRARALFTRITLWSFLATSSCSGFNDPTCIYDTAVSHNILSFDFYANSNLQYNINEFTVRTSSCFPDDFLLSFGGSTSNQYQIYKFRWATLNCPASLCNGTIEAVKCGISDPSCIDTTYANEVGTIDAGGDINTFTEIISPTFRIVPVR